MLRSLILVLTLVGFALSTAGPALAVSGRVVFEFDLQAPSDAQQVNLWLPYPVSDEFQRISRIKWDGNYDRIGIYRAPESGVLYMLVQWKGQKQKREFEFSFHVTTRERSTRIINADREYIPPSIKRFLHPEPPYLTTDGKIKEIARKITAGKNGILQKARAIYDWTVENTYRDPNVKGCGLGLAERMLSVRGGKCADISSVFVALARAASVPARDVFGIRLSKNQQQDITTWQHCWAEFYLPGTGWVPVDPADVRKAMLQKRLTLKEADPYREYFFGKVDEYRIILEPTGSRAVTLGDEQKGRPLAYLMYPYAEVDGKPLDYLNPERFRYRITFIKDAEDGL